MLNSDIATCTAFDGPRLLATGTLAHVALAARKAIESGTSGPVLVFDDASGRQIDIDLRGTPDDMLATLPPPPDAEAAPAPRGPGRPKLGVVAREVTLLPRHWDWLASQPGGASAVLRRLVEDARRASGERDRMRQAGEAVDRFMLAMAGNLPDYEEATRAFWRGERMRFTTLTDAWPDDVRDHARRLASRAWDDAPVDA